MGPINLLEQYIDATNTHDFENVERLLHPQAIYWFSDQTCRSQEEIKNYFENAWDTIKEEKYSAADIQWLGMGNDTATCVYHYHYEGYYKGEFIKGSGRATNVFVKDTDGNWKIIHEHLSSL